MATAFKAARLRTEYLENPIGMDEERPRFSWIMEDSRNSALQSAYQIVVDDESGTEVWDSGKVESGESVQMKYSGKPLVPMTKYSWKVRIYDHSGKASDWAAASFETGFMNRRWSSRWIETNHPGNPEYPVAYLRKEFSCTKKIVKARAYATALGIYEMSINGGKVSDNCFAPGWTDYHNRVQYQAYDVTKLLKKGENAVGAMLADGWFTGCISRNDTTKECYYGKRPAFRAELHVYYADGTKDVIVTNETWTFSHDGPIRHSDIYMGEMFNSNLRKNIEGWNKPGFKPVTLWRNANENHELKKNIEWNSGAPVRRIQEVKPVSVSRPTAKTIVLDFGQNLVGREKFIPNTEKDCWIHIKHGEMLNPDGTVYTENLRAAKATTSYWVEGAREEYEPSFTFYGFRYIEISGWEGKLDKNDFTAVVIHSDMERTGYFECSNKLVNQLYSNLVWGQKGNYLDIPTDCPQRNERLGWTGDTQVFINVASYNYDVGAFFTKFIEDLNLCRNEWGEYPHFAPLSGRWGRGAASAWADAGVICPYHIYLKYGDKTLLEKYYPQMRRWILSERDNSEDLIYNQACFGDWLHLNANTPPDLISTAFFAYGAELVEKFARILGHQRDAEEMAELREKIKAAFTKKFIGKDGSLTVKTQTAAILALYFDMVPEKSRAKIVKDFADDIVKNRGCHLSTGFIGTSYIVHALATNGQTELAYKLLEQTTYPGWLYSVTQGATTIWERWNSWSHVDGFGDVGMNSFNHYAYGAVGDFMYNTICGIRPCEDVPAFKRFVIAPVPGGTLTHASASYMSAYGLIKSSWEKLKDSKLEFSVTIPANTTAEVFFPADSLGKVKVKGGGELPGEKVKGDSPVLVIGSGTYTFVCG